MDLNPIRAKMADTPEESEHTSVGKRIEFAATGSSPKHGSRSSAILESLCHTTFVIASDASLRGQGHAWMAAIVDGREYLLEATSKRCISNWRSLPLAALAEGYDVELQFYHG